ncbi:hypothetical protein H2201_002492 [Coniosporium apollinis]|uniref:DUF747-domain-containing protein n=1 Tax=Coniosporium apollinis TaxID=61459 RepID=A0ABQ9NY37_9PEZI|nr:hypothetical protein H2201_002492 [Coniosporium apollinis]
MSGLREPDTNGRNGDILADISSNGQLPTPAPSETGQASEEEIGDSIPSLIIQHNEEAVVANGHSKHPDYDYFALDGTTESKPLRNGGTPGQDSRKRSIGKLASPAIGQADREKVLKLSPAQIQELTHSPSSLPVRTASPLPEELAPLVESSPFEESGLKLQNGVGEAQGGTEQNGIDLNGVGTKAEPPRLRLYEEVNGSTQKEQRHSRPSFSSRTVSTPVIRRKQSSRIAGPGQDQSGQQRAGRPPPLNFDENKTNGTSGAKAVPSQDPLPSPLPANLPLPPLSLPTYLQLELSSEKPSPLYIHRSPSYDFPYESSKVKFERLLNFLWLAPQLEQVLWFGALACLDAWLYTFTILPLRFFRAIWVLIGWVAQSAVREAKDLASFVYSGLGRLWRRKRQQSDVSVPGTPAPDGLGSRRTSLTARPPLPTPAAHENVSSDPVSAQKPQPQRRHTKSNTYRSRRTKPKPSALLPDHKADILNGLLVLASCMILMRFDASRMYHGIRGQAAIKLYVIYNVLEVCDRLFSSLGQDIMECLLSRETLERDTNGRSKVIRPLWMFTLALIYNVIHATALFYQVITLNVAVNSYSNALLTLLMSNQFVEIKSTVFKKFEKENLFQLTCADVVERFQLWLMLLIIALRNIVEVGGLSILGDISGSTGTASVGSNATSAPFRSTSIIPKSFTLFPKWTGQVLGPFLLVLGSEMLVDWLKHCYVTKFNNVKPAVYGRFLDVLAKDYYSHAFADQNLTKRLGLPLLPLSCLFIRALIQTYHMFLATHMPLPIPSTATSLAVESASAATSPATTAALAHIDAVFRRALGRSSFGAGAAAGDASWWSLSAWTLDDVIAFVTMGVVFLVAYLLLLTLKLVLGMALLSFARSRYRDMKERERAVVDTAGKRVGGWGVVEVGEEKRRWIYADDPEGLRALREREERARSKEEKGGDKLGGVRRYSMVAKRIW